MSKRWALLFLSIIPEFLERKIHVLEWKILDFQYYTLLNICAYECRLLFSQWVEGEMERTLGCSLVCKSNFFSPLLLFIGYKIGNVTPRIWQFTPVKTCSKTSIQFSRDCMSGSSCLLAVFSSYSTHQRK